jgi:hypothetical protein
MDKQKAAKLIDGWKKALKATRAWSEKLDFDV